MVTVVPECIQAVEPRVSVSRGVKGKMLQTSCGNICVEMESGWKCMCFLCCRFLHWELACFTKWLTAQPCNKQGCLSRLRAVHPLSVFLLYQLSSTFRAGGSGMQILILTILVSCYLSPLWPSNFSFFSLIIQIWVSVPASQEESRYPWLSNSFHGILMCF